VRLVGSVLIQGDWCPHTEREREKKIEVLTTRGKALRGHSKNYPFASLGERPQEKPYLLKP
jgi:hypothetical protein